MSTPLSSAPVKGKVTVISPARNAAAFFPAWLETIASQQYDPLEVMLVDDGSDDFDSPHGLRALSQSAPAYVRYLRLEGVGPAAARNAALAASDSEFVAFLDLDDLWTHDHLRRSVAVLEQDPELGFVQGQIRKFLRGDDGELYYCSPPYNFVNLGSAVYRRSVFTRCGVFDPTLTFGEDFDHIFRCWEMGIPKRVLPEVSLLYQRHAGNMTNGKNTVDLGAVRVYKRRLDRMRLGKVDPSLVEERRVPFYEYLGRTEGPFDEGLRERVIL